MAIAVATYPVTGFTCPVRLPQAKLHLPRQTQLPLRFTLPSGMPATPEPSFDNNRGGVQNSVRSNPIINYPTAAEGEAKQPVGLPHPGRWAGQLIQAMLEVMGGKRPITQLVRWTSAEVYQHLSKFTSPTLANQRPQIRSLHVSLPCITAAEICATVVQGSRVAALALRLETIRGQWQCTALAIG